MLLIATLIGIFVAPAVVVLAVVLALLGYLIAVYLVGRTLWGWFGALPPDTIGERGIAALIGAAAVGPVLLIPYLGRLLILALTLTGIGALTVAIFRPALRSDGN